MRIIHSLFIMQRHYTLYVVFLLNSYIYLYFAVNSWHRRSQTPSHYINISFGLGLEILILLLFTLRSTEARGL